jgi:exonuclease VII small subunit
LFKTTHPGGKRVRRRRARTLSDGLAKMNRLDLELERACARYERAIAALDERADRLEHPSAAEIVRMAMAEATAEQTNGAEPIRLSSASFEELRGLGLSVTQTRRVLKLRDRGVLESTSRLDSVPGIPRGQIAALKLRMID